MGKFTVADEARIREFIQKNRDKSPTQIAGKLGLAVSTVFRHAKLMKVKLATVYTGRRTQEESDALADKVFQANGTLTLTEMAVKFGVSYGTLHGICVARELPYKELSHYGKPRAPRRNENSTMFNVHARENWLI
jgi:hypothetical protein